jgi:hypothetical protein
VPNQASISLRAMRLFCTAAMTLALGVCPAVASATSAGDVHRPVAHAAQSQQRAQARAIRRQERQTRRSERQARKQERQDARQAQRSERQAEREQRRASRASQGAEGSGATHEPAGPLANNEGSSPEGGSQPPKGAGEAQPLTAGHRQCALTAEASSAEIALGETVTISGKLSCPPGTDAGEQEVTVYGHQANGPAGLGVTLSATTAADGSYSLQSEPLNGRSVFYVHSPSVRGAIRVVVSVDGSVTLQGPATDGAALPMSTGKAAGGRRKEVFTGMIRPEEADRLVALRVRYGGGEWRTVAFARTDASGRFQLFHHFNFAGQVSVMASAHARGTARTQSQTITYSIAQAQDPAFTIQGSALSGALTEAPGASGQTTITGVATRHPNEMLTLLSRTVGTPFTRVDTAKSDDTGAYTFTVEPTQAAIYEVAYRGAHSTQLLLEAG